MTFSPFGMGGRCEPVEVPPSPRFKAAVLPIKRVSVSYYRPPSGRAGMTVSQKTGLRYEDKILCHLEDRYGNVFQRSPTIAFEDSSGPRCCIPDGLFHLPYHRTLVIEVKITHVPEAWWQLRKLYQPVVQKLFPEGKIEVVEICRTYDPTMPFPESVELVNSFEELCAPSDKFRVLPWRM